MSKSAQIAWGIAIVLGAIAVGEYFVLDILHRKSLERQVYGYELKLKEARLALEKAQAEAEARLDAAKQEAAATQQVIQAELDYQRLPELPIKTVLRPPETTGVRILYVENESREAFSCKVLLTRPGTDKRKEVVFELPARRFKDLAAIENWVFEPGDRIEFRKDGHKPRRLEIQ